MDNKEQTRESLVHRLLTGQVIFEVGNTIYKMVPPDIETLHKAEIAYNEAMHSNRFQSWLSENECVQILAIRGICSLDLDKEIKEVEKRIDDLKVSLFENFIKPQEFKRVRKDLDMVKSLYSKKLNLRHSLDHLTLNGYAEMIRSQYITLFSLRKFESDEKVWQSEECVDIRLLESVMSKQQSLSLDVSDVRKIARTEPWRSYWSASNHYPFSLPIYQLSAEQRTLIMFTKMYDSIHSSSDCPSDEIIEDDDLLDGWMIKERRQRESEKGRREIESKLTPGMSGAQDISFPASSLEEARKINSMNDMEGQILKKQRMAQVKSKGSMSDSEFIDKRMDLQMQANKQYINTAKGR